MEDALVTALVKQLQPAFYVIGSLTILIFVTFGGGILKLILDAKKDRERAVDVSLDGLKAAVIQNTNSICKLEVKLDMVVDKYDRDLNNLGRKVREMSP